MSVRTSLTSRKKQSLPLGPQVRKLASTPNLSPKPATRAPRSSGEYRFFPGIFPKEGTFTVRNLAQIVIDIVKASSALHLGRSACTVPEHDAMAKKAWF